MKYSNAQEARDARQQLRDLEMKVLAEVREAGEMSAENREKLDKIDVDFRIINRDIGFLERAEARAAEEATRGEPRNPEGKLTANDALKRFLLGDDKVLNRAVNVWDEATGSYGGYTVDTVLHDQITKALKEYGGMTSVAQIIRTDNSEVMYMPTIDDTAYKGRLVSQGTNLETSADEPTFSRITLSGYTASSDLVRVSRKLLRNSSFDIATFIGQLLAERVMRQINYYATLGSGSGQPKGAVNAATYGEVLTASGAYTRTDLLNLVHSLDPAYRRNGKIMMNDATMKIVRAITDTYGQPLYSPDPRLGAPATIEGLEVVINQDMASAAAAAKTIIVGDFTRFVIRLAGGLEIRRSDERFFDTDEVGFVVLQEYDSNLLTTGAIKYGYQSAT